MKNFKRILCSIMMLCILASMLPVSSIAADTPDVYVGGVLMQDGCYLKSGSASLQHYKPTSGGYAYYKDGTVILNGYKYTGDGYMYSSPYGAIIYSKDSLDIYVEDNSTIATLSDKCDAVLSYTGDVTIRSNSKSLRIQKCYYGIYGNDVLIEGAVIEANACTYGIYALGDVTLDPTLRVDFRAEKTGIYAEGDVSIISGFVNSSGIIHGVWAKGSVNIQSANTYIACISSTDDATDDFYALRFGNTFTCDSDLLLRACVDGSSDLVPYVEANNQSYDIVRTNVPVYISGVQMYPGDYLVNGASSVTHTKPDDAGYAYYAAADSAYPLIDLYDYEYEGKGYEFKAGEYAAIYSPIYTLISVNRGNTSVITQTDDDSYGVYGECGVKFHIYDNLKISGGYSAIYSARATIQITYNDLEISDTDVGLSAPNGSVILENLSTVIKAENTGIYANEGVSIDYVVDITCNDNSDAVQSHCAIYIENGSVDFHENLSVRAATSPDAQLDVYVSSFHNSYDRIVTYDAVIIAGITINDGYYLASGAAAMSTTKPDGGYAYYKDGTLTLHDFTLEANEPEYENLIDFSSAANIVLEGENTLYFKHNPENLGWSYSPNIIYSYGDITISGDGSLTASGNECAISASGHLTINGGDIDIDVSDGTAVSVSRSIIINDGNIDVVASVNTAIFGLDEIVINGGNVNATGTRGLSSRGNVIINGGTVEAISTATGEDDDEYYAILYGDLTVDINDEPYDGTLIVADGIYIAASTEPDGTFVEYNADDHTTYDHIKITVPYTVSFDANGGAGAMADEKAIGSYTLPESTFEAPEGDRFKCWLVNGTEKAPGAVIEVTEDITVKAIWEEIPHVHVYDQEVASDEYKADDADCVNPASYYKSCECGERGTETFFYGSALGHTESDWKCDDENHWKECTTDGCGAIIDGSLSAHTPDHEGGATEDYAIKCTVCGYEMEAQLEHVHVYDKEVASDEYKASDADCVNPATYYKSCKCGERGTETFEHGATAPHSESEWMSDDENHWKQCTNENCAAIIEGSTAPHADTDNDNKCDTCGHEIENPPTSDSAIAVIAITAICAATTFAFVVFKKRYAR